MLRKISYSLFAIVALALLPASDASARRIGNKDVTDVGGGGCVVAGNAFNLSSGGPWSRLMTVTSGSECGGTFSAGGRIVFKRLYLVTQPQHGTVALREGGHYHYVSTAGYHGTDNFTLRVCGSGANGKLQCADLQYAVTVQ